VSYFSFYESHSSTLDKLKACKFQLNAIINIHDRKYFNNVKKLLYIYKENN